MLQQFFSSRVGLDNFFGDTRVLVEAVGEEKPLIEIILQIMTIIPILFI